MMVCGKILYDLGSRNTTKVLKRLEIALLWPNELKSLTKNMVEVGTKKWLKLALERCLKKFDDFF